MDLFLAGFSGFVLGVLIIYFYLKSSQISRHIFEELQQKFTVKETEYANAERKIADLSFQLQEEKDKSLQMLAHQDTIKSHLVKTTAERDLQTSQLQDLQEINKNNQEKTSELIQENQKYFAEISRLKAINENMSSAMEEQKKAIEKLQEESKIQFENIANKILEEKTEKFTNTNKENLNNILKPLGENLEAFKKKVDEVYQNESRERFSLKDTIKLMMEQSNKISQEANNLASALKGQTKMQGDWGEMILERILENSGLTKGREYFAQMNIKNENGENQRPDFVLQLPGNQMVIIDSKVSLNSYEKMTSCEDPEEQKRFLNLHIAAIKKHIDTLALKRYDNLKEAIDFTIMFVPIEPAFLVAMQNDSNLWNYAYHKHIIILSPTNLIAYLKLISDVWKKSDQNENAMEIARQAGGLYDKFEGFINDLTSMGKKMDAAKSDYENAMKKLSTGNGNLVKRVQNLKDLGAKAMKTLPEELIEKANDTDHE